MIVVASVRFGVTVDRWVRIRDRVGGDDPPFRLDDAGFLVTPTGETQGWVRPRDAAVSGAWVLLGEPGAGKTTAFRQLVPNAQPAGEVAPGQGGTVWLTGAELCDTHATDTLLGPYLDGLPAKTAPAEARDRPPLVIVIDQLDESAFLPKLPMWLKRRLSGRDTTALRMWIACRTAEYPDKLTTVLRIELGQCLVGDLAPLTRADAVELAASTGADATAFLAAVLDNAAGPFAAIPLTLRVFLEAFNRDRDAVTRGPRSVFTLGVTVLMSEPDPGRDNPRPTETTVEQRMAIAGRVAAHLLLSGRRWVDTYTAGHVADLALPVGQVVGAQESAGAGAFPVTAAMVTETLATAVFTRTGPDRVAFAHSSFAAFLAARHLAARAAGPAPIPRRQLESFFLVDAPDENTAAIPEHLRELAAWLLAHAPAQTRWLADADPESLTAHTFVVTDPQIRRILVDGLLARAERIELADRAWQHARWNLDHPGLADQLTAALTTASRDLHGQDRHLDEQHHEGGQWPQQARLALALRLCADTRLPALADAVLGVVENVAVPVSLRQLAASTALTLDTAPATITRLRAVLRELADVADRPGAAAMTGHLAEDVPAAPTGDSPLELVATLLGLLWPAHLDFAEAVVHLRPGMPGLGLRYRIEVHSFADGVADDDVATLMEFTEQTLRDCGAVMADHDPDGDHGAGSGGEDGGGEAAPGSAEWVWVPQPPVHPAAAAELRAFVLSVADRVLRSPFAQSLAGRVARMLMWFLRSSDRVPIPAVIDVVRQDGSEPDEVRDLRRCLAEELLRAACAVSPAYRPYWSYRVLVGWRDAMPRLPRGLADGLRHGHRRRLLDHADADWAFSQARHHRPTDPVLAAAFHDAAEMVSTPPEPAPAESTTTWDEAATFAAAQRARLQRAVAGDTTAFWTLIKHLGVNPATGRWEPIVERDVTDFVGAALWDPPELTARLREAAALYVTSEHDHHHDWLGLERLDWRAYAGVVAVTVLLTPPPGTGRHDAPDAHEELSVPDHCWRHWVGALLEHASRDPDTQRLGPALDRAARHAPAELAAALTQYVRTRFVHSPNPTRLPPLPPQIAPTVQALAVELHAVLRDTTCTDVTENATVQATPVLAGPITPRTYTEARRGALAADWADLLTASLRVDDRVVVELALDIIDHYQDYRDPDLGLQVAVRVAHALLLGDAAQYWPVITQCAAGSQKFARLLALACTESESTQRILDDLPDDALAEVYRWLATAYPPDTETPAPEFYRGTADIDVHRWLRRTATELASRATPDAVRDLRHLVTDHPALLDLQAALHEARRAVQNKTAVRLTPQEVTALLADRDRRIVRTAHQLAAVICDTLDAIAADLPTHGNLLWDCERGMRPASAAPNAARPLRWRPKPEGALGAYLAHELHLRLVLARVIVNREVIIRPTDHGDSGERPDIKIDVVSPEDNSAEAPVISIPVEIKGAWHPRLRTAQADQLAERYLADMDTTDGIYLVGWFPLHHWNTPSADDTRRSRAANFATVEELRTILADQSAAILRQTDRRTHPYILIVPRAVPAEDTTTSRVHPPDAGGR